MDGSYGVEDSALRPTLWWANSMSLWLLIRGCGSKTSKAVKPMQGPSIKPRF